MSLFLCVSSAAAADLSSAQPVYFWPMEGALDQYIAQEASAVGVVSVTVDPKMAKAILTDRIDANFLAGMDELFPLPGVEEESSEEEEETSDSVETGLQKPRPANRALSRPHGTLFLVDAKTRRVLWSTFLGDYDRSPKKLNGEAKSVVQRMMAAMNGS